MMDLSSAGSASYLVLKVLKFAAAGGEFLVALQPADLPGQVLVGGLQHRHGLGVRRSPHRVGLAAGADVHHVAGQVGQSGAGQRSFEFDLLSDHAATIHALAEALGAPVLAEIGSGADASPGLLGGLLPAALRRA